MKIDIHFLIFLAITVFLIEIIVLGVQYFIDKESDKNSFGWWSLGNVFNLLGLTATFFRDNIYIGKLSIVGNNIFFALGIVFIYVGTAKFYNDYKVKKIQIFSIILMGMNAVYYTYVDDNVKIRVVVLSIFLSVGSFFIVKKIMRNMKSSLKISSYFLLVTFVLHSIFFSTRALVYIICPPEEMFASSTIQVLTYLFTIVQGTLSTFGFIMIFNQRLNDKIMESNQNFELIFNTSPDAILITSLPEGKFVFVNEGFVKQSGYEASEVLGKSIVEVNIWKNLEEREKFLKHLMEKGSCDNVELLFNTKSGKEFVGLTSATIIKLSGVKHVISVTRDITERQKIQNKLAENEKFLTEVIENSGALIYVKDYKGKYKLVNRKWEIVTGLGRDIAIGNTDMELFSPKDAMEIKKMDEKVFTTGKIQEKEEILENEYGKRYFISIKFPVKDKNNKVIELIGISTEITERKEHEKQVEMLAVQLEIEKKYAQMNSITDGLTGLFNRRYFDDTLRKEFYRFKRSGVPLSLIIMDIDFFKNYNDNYGHLRGDECLKEVAATVKKFALRVTDTAARFGGEEFIMILPNANSSGALKIAEETRKAVENLKILHEKSDISKYVTISLGVATIEDNNVLTSEEILSMADEALYLAKNSGRNKVIVANKKNNHLIQLNWNLTNECGNELIDNEHKELINYSNELLNAINKNYDKKSCLVLIEDLINKIVKHFQNEENIFDNISYPNKEKHKKSHELLVKRAMEISKKYKEDKLDVSELFAFLIYDIVAQHMELEDKEYFPYIIQEIKEKKGE